MLSLTRRCGQSLIIGNLITVHVGKIDSDGVRLNIDAPREIEIVRDDAKSIDDRGAVASSVRNVTFRMTPDQHKRLDQAMMLCKRQRTDGNTLVDGQLLEAIAMDWLGSRGAI